MKYDFVEEKLNSLEWEEIEDMADWLYKNKRIDYSYTTLKEAAPMIIEDYYTWKFTDKIDNIMGHLFSDIEYNTDYYNYLCYAIGADKVEENIAAAVVEYIANQYDFDLVDRLA